MGMSTNIKGIRDFEQGGEFDKMLKVKEACEAAGIDYPPEVRAFFPAPEESLDYNISELEEISLGDCVSEWKADMQEGYEVEVAKIPPGVKKIRFYNSW